MLRTLQQLFDTRIRPEAQSKDASTEEHGLKLAAATLLVEMSRADDEVAGVERDAVLQALERAFDLPSEETRELLELAEQEADHAISLQYFTRLIHDNFAAEQKFHLVELMWQVAVADGHIDKYEEYLVRRVAELLYVPHSQFIRAKHNVLGDE